MEDFDGTTVLVLKGLKYVRLILKYFFSLSFLKSPSFEFDVNIKEPQLAYVHGHGHTVKWYRVTE